MTKSEKVLKIVKIDKKNELFLSFFRPKKCSGKVTFHSVWIYCIKNPDKALFLGQK